MSPVGYAEAIAHLDALGIDAMKSMRPTLRRIEAICEALDHPERSVPAIHITGTNGKTSTARIATSILASTGLSVGTYTSPHLQSIRERIALNGAPISRDDFGDTFDHLYPYLVETERALGERLTYFEVMTAMFYLWAAEAPVDVMVVEVGLGGRWDATNVVPAPVAVITNIALDHVALLGQDRVSIAREKAGIIKHGATAVTAERSPEVLAVVSEAAGSNAAHLRVLGRDFDLVENKVAFGGRYLSVELGRRPYRGLFLPLHGAHQGVNAAVALAAVAALLPEDTLDEDLVREGMSGAAAPGRLESVRGPGDRVIVLDVAHNPDGMSALVRALIDEFVFERVIVTLGILSDKDHAGMLAELSRLPCKVIATRASSGRAVAPEDLAADAAAVGLGCEPVEGVVDALQRAVAEAGEGDLVVVTGSHYVVGEARDHLVGRPA